jgi:hypothetical protein
MTQQTIPVTPANVTTVNVALPTGATIYNTDTANAIWVSSATGVTPGTGIRVGPRGSIQWTTNGAACYACTDTGVSQSVTITVSTDTANPVNPIDVATATATALLAQGIPSVFLGELIESGTNLPALGGPNTYGFLNLDVSRFASIVVYLNPGAIGQISTTCQDGSGAYNLGSFDFPYTYTAGGGVSFAIPVTGPLLDLVLASTATTYVYAVYGSNRSVPANRVFTGTATNKIFRVSQAFTDGTRVDIPVPFTSNGKGVYCRIVVTGGGKGLFGYMGFNAAGALEQCDLVDTSLGAVGVDGSETRLEIYLPPGKIQLYFYPRFTGTYIFKATLVQEQ